jgi:nucleoside-diphosphate-sugar epimerase
LVTGSGGLIGSEAVRHFAGLGLDVVGIDNDMRQEFFGAEASTAWNVRRLTDDLGRRTRTTASTSGTGTRWRSSSRATAGTSPW